MGLVFFLLLLLLVFPLPVQGFRVLNRLFYKGSLWVLVGLWGFGFQRGSVRVL